MSAPLVAEEEEEDSEERRLVFKANPIQWEFITARNQADLFSSRFGEGKSTALCWAAYLHAEQHPNIAVNALMVRDTWENLRDTTLEEFFFWFERGVCGEWVAGTKTWHWRMGEMRGKIKWIGMDVPKDAAKLQSRPLGWVGFDEPAPVTGDTQGIDETIFNTALARLRQPKVK